MRGAHCEKTVTDFHVPSCDRYWAVLSTHHVVLNCVSTGSPFSSHFAIDFQLLSLRRNSFVNKSEPQTAVIKFQPSLTSEELGVSELFSILL